MSPTKPSLVIVAACMNCAVAFRVEAGESNCPSIHGHFLNEGIETYEGERKSTEKIYLTALANASSNEIRKVVRIAKSDSGRPTLIHLGRDVGLELSGGNLSLVFFDFEGKVLATVPAPETWVCEGGSLSTHHDERHGAEGFPGKVHVDETLQQEADGSLVWIARHAQFEGRNGGGPQTWRYVRRFPSFP
jgi:hypothetical protein